MRCAPLSRQRAPWVFGSSTDHPARTTPKERPSFYSKPLALASFLRAVERCPDISSVVFLNDAPIPADNLGVKRESGGDVIDQAGLRLPTSYRKAD